MAVTNTFVTSEQKLSFDNFFFIYHPRHNISDFFPVKVIDEYQQMYESISNSMFLDLEVNLTCVLLILRMSGPASTGIKERCRVFIFMSSTEAVNGHGCNYLFNAV